jgi:hypothetical protein
VLVLCCSLVRVYIGVVLVLCCSLVRVYIGVVLVLCCSLVSRSKVRLRLTGRLLGLSRVCCSVVMEL